ncbi:alpha-L-rhamnosidase N-terminal domain-containing protein [uncultured Draconibacterium sp.]|uniref:alpha-L-rhamnosidase-related protein n=1 Tax=uncultured Draconibacterium sp. TaxID=1573823 RepID=UPI0029C66654|nr:alpha-L-rhamnosidase N-terminal domain-containing protein [uncultured Draconibacterium sp.]
MRIKHLITTLIFLYSFSFVGAQNETWISYPSANNTGYGVYHFRKSINLNGIPEKMVIHVSADNRYNLFINGKRVCYGPAKGDLKTYKYDVIDIAPFLRDGKNQIAALIYNGGEDKALSLQSVQTAFMLLSENEDYSNINTDKTWKVFKNPAYKPISYYELNRKEPWFYGFYACGPCDNFDSQKHPWGWETIEFDDRNWGNAEELIFEGKAPWNLVPRNIAFMDNHLEYPAQIRLAEGVDIVAGAWKGNKPLVIPANTRAKFLIDFEKLTMGYPELTVAGGTSSSIKVKYAEALYEKVNLKGHRDSVNNLTMFGIWDVFHPDGNKRTFRPLWKRTFRYVQFVVETKNEPLEILSYQNEYSGYPYAEMATFESNDSRLNEIFEMCQQTLRMCSGETYYDTPFYEQLNYGGDNLPISALSAYNSIDDRLLREMLRLYSQSENKETGLFKSAYPSRFDFDQGTWSMAWIQTLNDYYTLRGDLEFIRPFTSKMEGILEYFERHLDETTGMIGCVNNTNFVDWSVTKGRLARYNEKGEIIQSTMLTLYFAHTIDCAVKLFKQMGLSDKAQHWATIGKRIKAGVYINCWDENEQLFRDYPDNNVFSQHSNLLAILCDVIPPAEQKEMLNRILSYNKFEEVASSYFSFFLFKAMQKTDQEHLFLENLDFWYQYLDRGFTTCGETGFASHDRSDCHAWSAHPAYYLLSSVCGIKPADIGFNNVKIRPHLGRLHNVSASMPHPKGRISIEYKITKDKMKAIIKLPKGMSGDFEYRGKYYALGEGENEIDCK